MVMKILKRNDQTPLPINDIDRLHYYQKEKVTSMANNVANASSSKKEDYSNEAWIIVTPAKPLLRDLIFLTTICGSAAFLSPPHVSM